MALIRSQDGNVKVNTPSTTPQSTAYNVTNAEAVGQVSSWELTLNNDNQEITSFTDDFAEFVNTTKRWTGTIAAFFDPNTTAVGHDEIMECMLPGSFSGSLAGTGDLEGQLLFNFYVDDTQASASKDVFWGNALVLNAAVRHVVGDVSRLDVSLQGSGLLSYTTSGT